MMPQKTIDVDEYLRGLDPERQAALEQIRALIFQTVPDVSETMKYRMPTYELNHVIVSMPSQKHYMSLYMDTELVAKHQDELSHLNCGKSCIRFKKLDDLPLETIERIIKETVEKQQQPAG